jgi:heptaprenyl diphosphate synthase
MLSGAGESATEILTRYGERIGVAFQLSDDLLDVDSDVGVTGKTPGTDLREGVRTLPMLHVLRDRQADDERLVELLESDLTDDIAHAEALALLRTHPAMERARETVRAYAEDARTTLDPLPDTAAKRALASLCDTVVDRHS